MVQHPQSAEAAGCQLRPTVHKYFNVPFSCIQVASKWNSMGCSSLLNWKTLSYRFTSNPLQLDTEAASTPSTTGCEMDYLIKLPLLYICFLFEILPGSEIIMLQYGKESDAVIMACLDLVLSSLNWGFPAFRNFGGFYCLCPSFWDFQ